MNATVTGNRFISLKALPGDDLAYVRVVRPEEDQAERALLDGDLVYVRAPRKTGKTTLAARLAVRLAGAGGEDARLVCDLRLRGVGMNPAAAFPKAFDDLQSEAFSALAQAADLDPAVIRGAAGASPDWFWVAVSMLARDAPLPVVVFVDEIEQILGSHRAIGEPWLIALRELHLQANRFTACVLGRLPPRLLVRSPELTPFNTAREIVLPDFDEPQIKEMAKRIGAEYDGASMAGILARAVYRQTAGQPHLTQCLLRALEAAYAADPEADYDDVISDFVEGDAECQPSTANAYMDVDELFEQPSVWPAKRALTVYAGMLEGATLGGRGDPMVLADPWNDAHIMLDAVGLARIEPPRPSGERYLVARSRIARRIFNHRWAIKRLTGLGEAEPAGDVSRALAEMEALAITELCRTQWAVDHRASVTPGSGREVVQDSLFEFELVRESPPERLTLQMFKGVGEFAKLLWMRQVRTLRHLSGRASSLPNIYRGGLLAEDTVAYIITQRPQLTLADEGFHDYVRANRDWAVDQFTALAHGLLGMSQEGMSHRNIWPGSIRMDPPEEGLPPPRVKLANFEFSVLLRAMLAAGEDPEQQIVARRQTLRRAFLLQPAASRPYASPELLKGLFDQDSPLPAKVTSDVFSLGMVATGWFVAPLDADAFEAVLKVTSPGEAIYDDAAHGRYLASLVGQIEQAIARRRLPAALGRVLQDMIHPDANARLRPAELCDLLEEAAPAFRAWSAGHRQPLLVCYSYQQTAEQLMQKGRLTSALGSEQNQSDVEALLARELANAPLYHAPRGIAPFVSDPNSDQEGAQWVFKGANWLFYCQRYERRAGGFGGVRTPTSHILRIAYVWPMREAWRGVPAKTVNLRAFGPLVVVEQNGSREMNPDRDNHYRSWDSILKAAQQITTPPSFEIAQAAFTWLVESQREDLDLHRFPIEATKESRGRERVYSFDEETYRKRVDASALRSIVHRSSFFRNHRDRFEQVFQDALASGRTAVRVRSSTGSASGFWSDATLIRADAATITLRGRSLPEHVWIELDDARLARRPLNQQAAAITRLSATPTLFDQLLEPHVVVDNDLVGEDSLQSAVSGLAGRAGEIVRRIVASSPLMALQGPPGTGKTTVIAAVVQSLLAEDQTRRILITSQSHAAVDNIAQRIIDLGMTGDDGLISVRVAADESFEDGGGVADAIRSWRPEAVAMRLSARVRSACKDRLASLDEADPRRAAYEQLAVAVQDGALEMVERVRESAALVFSTTAGTRRVVDDGFLAADRRFDLAVVDEASKALPMEIVQPMLLAERQLLVGDHRQLPAFGSVGIERLLANCIASGRDDFQLLANNRKAIRAWLKLFASFFEDSADKFVAPGEGEAMPGWRDNKAVSEELDLQFRMRSDIADVVSHTFYKGKLLSDPTVDDRPRPEWLKAFAEEIDAPKGILWVDTRPGEFFASASPVCNEDQARLAANLLARAVALGAGREGREAVVLSPYLAQKRMIEAQLRERGHHDLTSAVRTVDSFQGQEAELVILSLTRGPPADRESGTATSRYGFMIQPERVNVMFSRGRELVVVLGDFDFFLAAQRVERENNRENPIDLSFWETLCRRIERTGRLTDNDSLPARLRVR